MYPPIYELCSAYMPARIVLGEEPRVYPFGEAPQGVQKPYAVWQIVSGAPENYLGDRPDTDTFAVQVDVYADGATEARRSAYVIRDAIEGDAYVTAWRGESRDRETGSYRISFDASFVQQRRPMDVPGVPVMFLDFENDLLLINE